MHQPFWNTGASSFRAFHLATPPSSQALASNQTPPTPLARSLPPPVIPDTLAAAAPRRHVQPPVPSGGASRSRLAIPVVGVGREGEPIAMAATAWSESRLGPPPPRLGETDRERPGAQGLLQSCWIGLLTCLLGLRGWAALGLL